MEEKKNKQDATEYSKDEFLSNPVACANDVTGYVQRLPSEIDEAISLADLTRVPVASLDDKSAEGKAR